MILVLKKGRCTINVGIFKHRRQVTVLRSFTFIDDTVCHSIPTICISSNPSLLSRIIMTRASCEMDAIDCSDGRPRLYNILSTY